jgi:uncharacterized protein (DUF885 family)
LPDAPAPTDRLPRPSPAVRPGPLDETFYDLVETRFRRLVANDPIFGTFLGRHERDHELGDAGRELILDEIEADRRHMTAIESIAPDDLSADVRFERDLELHNVRRSLFEAEVVRLWERRSLALDAIGDGLFLLFARDHAPLAERLDAITGRLEEVPAYLEASRSRATQPQVRFWQEIEIETATELPALFDEVGIAADGVLAASERRRLDRAVEAAKVALELYTGWLEGTLAGGGDDWQLGPERYDELVERRAFDGLCTDDILELGQRALADASADRASTAREIDPGATEREVVNRVKADHPATFGAALMGYRDAMLRARAHLIEHELVTVPSDERVEVIETPEYLRRVMPFAAYFEPAAFDHDAKGIYVVTPSVDGDANAMREHNWASISNTSIHEAYPGHHLQLDMARRNPSLTRLLADAPEFVEGWGMYSELMMREQGFDADARHRLVMHTDAIWRACRIILDVRLHRGELSLDEAVDFLADRTGFERANAEAEIRWYTYRPTYPLSYLLGRTLLLELRADEQRRLGDAFSLRAFHDHLMRNGSLPISFHRRLLAGDGA